MMMMCSGRKKSDDIIITTECCSGLEEVDDEEDGGGDYDAKDSGKKIIIEEMEKIDLACEDLWLAVRWFRDRGLILLILLSLSREKS